MARAPGAAALRAAIVAMLARRAPGATICPSEVAREVGGAGWRALMEPVRAQARGLVRRGTIEVVQRGRVVDPASARGPIRLRARVAPARPQAPLTPDGRYLVVRGRLWRASNPGLSAGARQRAVDELMAARRAVRDAGSAAALRRARAAVQAAKVALGERGQPWWTDGARDWNRFLVKNTPYATWFDALV